MAACLAIGAFEQKADQAVSGSDHFHSVEFSIDGMDLAYQFKIWNLASSAMCVLVREDSSIVQKLRVGDVMSMKYYANGYAAPIECRNTAIRHITKDEQGPFRGHYVVGLEIVEQPATAAKH